MSALCYGLLLFAIFIFLNIKTLISTSFSQHRCTDVSTSSLFYIFHCMYSLECVIQAGSVQFWNSSSQRCLPQKEMVDLSHVQSIETDAWQLQLLWEDSCIPTTSVHKYTADLIPLHSNFCLFNLWIPKQISVWSRWHFFSALVDIQRQTVWQLEDGNCDGAPGGHVLTG